jgi:pimeloyl-ACP methyl ester carboxylesterase
MTEFAEIEGGRIAYDMTGQGPLVLLSHGLGDHRQAYRFLAPQLAQAGYRVVNADVRGHGESSLNWKSLTGKAAISRVDIARDQLALIRQLGGPALIVGQSISGGAATIAAAREPELVSGIVEINPFTRVPKFDLGAMLNNRLYHQGAVRMGGVAALHSLRSWLSYLNVAYPTKPADYAGYIAALRAKLTEPGRMAELLKTLKTSPADAETQLPNVRCPALIIMGTQDCDFPDPRAEGDAIAAAMPAGLGTVATIDGAGHYPHAQHPDQVAALMIPFLAKLAYD